MTEDPILEDDKATEEWIRRGNTDFSWMHYWPNGKLTTLVNLYWIPKAIWRGEWQALKNITHVLLHRKPKIAWHRDWTDWIK